MKKILVPVDGSENSKKALIEAKKIGEIFNSEIIILNVVKDIIAHPYLATQDYGMKTNEGLMELGKELLIESLKTFEGFSGIVKTKIKYGDAGRGIVEEVEEGDYDLVVMGSRGLGAFSRAMLGSVSNKVLNHVNTNVLIIK